MLERITYETYLSLVPLIDGRLLFKKLRISRFKLCIVIGTLTSPTQEALFFNLDVAPSVDHQQRLCNLFRGDSQGPVRKSKAFVAYLFVKQFSRVHGSGKPIYDKLVMALVVVVLFKLVT